MALVALTPTPPSPLKWEGEVKWASPLKGEGFLSSPSPLRGEGRDGGDLTQGRISK
jgi:hypothetical protein